MYSTEAELQIQICTFLDIILPANSIYHHSANEGRGNKVQFYRKLKRMGFKAGWPDLEIITPGSQTLFLELKRPGNYATIHQKEIHTRLKAAGALVYVCKSINEVYEALKGVLSIKRHPAATAMLLHEETMQKDLLRMRSHKRQDKNRKVRKLKAASI